MVTTAEIPHSDHSLAMARVAAQTKPEVVSFACQAKRVQPSASIQPRREPTMQASAQTQGAQGDAEIAQVDVDLASELIASCVHSDQLLEVVGLFGHQP